MEVIKSTISQTKCIMFSKEDLKNDLIGILKLVHLEGLYLSIW